MLREDSNDEKLPMTGRLTPIGGTSSDNEYGRRFFPKLSNLNFIFLHV